ncbi:MLL3 [Lepeophtheirus salmonis]|uniref:MLL3 n=1 Tax=Lepeophtheirus salmonis TaxID=72036 RepID=A0A7R8CAK7_LEPSM|nr:MLL3 [Lepeophtheirus salmonis]CAF2749569.1 MLL3 [Lepeophtheirus salmonis]
MKHQGLRLQIPPPNQQISSQQPSPGLTPRSDGGNDDINDCNSSKGDNSFDSSTGTPDFSNGLDPPQKVVKRRSSQQQKRRQSGGNKDGAVKKRARKGSKADETDYDSYMESENLKSEGDYYNTMPFGNDPPIPYIPSVKITSRGFYKQEFENAKNRNMDSDVNMSPQSPDVFYSSSPEPDYEDTKTIKNEPIDQKTKTKIQNSLKNLMNGSEEKSWFDLDPDDSEEEETPNKLCKIDSRPKSPSIDIVHPIPIRPKSGQPFSFKVENNNIELDSVSARKLQSFLPSKNGGSFKAVTLTLSGNNGSTKHILKALNGLAKILKIETPKQWLAEDYKHGPRDVFRVKGEGDKDLSPMDLQSVLVEESLSFLTKSEKEEAGPELVFCHSKCYFQFAAARTKEINGDLNINSLDELVEFKTKRKENEVEDKSKNESKEQEKEMGPKHKGTIYKNWKLQSVSSRKHKQLTENELMQMMFKMGVTIMPPRETDDTRVCLFCHIRGDAASDGPARLLNFDVDKWVHLNCALWSEEVYETVSGALVNVETAIKNGVNLYCKVCEKNGATVKCFKVRCSSYYHVGCAAKDRTVFYKNKSVYCSQHIPKGEKDQELTTLAVYRRVFIERDENRLAAKVMDTSDNDSYLMRIGSMIFLSVGQLLPHQLHNFHTKDFIYPIGYKIKRYYWSMVNLNKRTAYTCSINEVNNKPEFHITVGEDIDGEVNKTYKGATAKDVWMQILDRVDKLRRENDLVKVLESLPGIESLTDYNFKYGRNPLLELPLAVNPSGCARLEPQMRTRVKRVHNFSTYYVNGLETTGPYSKNFVQSKSSQYRKMKMEWRQNVVLARSGIQGLGLYAARDLEKHQMIIEYIGEIIRSDLTDIREKYYESQNRGIYMFRLDDDRVLDATMSGGMARYINHCCDPSCVTETVEVDKDFHIIIFANRRISRGEELSYDYKFDYEDDNRIPCLCGASNCRKWMN